MTERMEEALRGFLRHLAAKGYSQEVLDDYGEKLEVFLAFLVAQGVKDLKEVGEGALRAYETWVKEVARNPQTGERLSFQTQAKRLRAVKSFFRWMEWTGWVLVDPTGCLKPYKWRETVPFVFTREAVERMLGATETGTLGGIRCRAILEVWYGAGLMRGEMAGLRVADVEGGVVRVSGRVVPLEERAVYWLGNYLTQVRPKWALGYEGREELWLSATGEASTESALWQVLARFSRRAGLGGVVCRGELGFAGRLRGSRAAHWLLEGMAQEEVGRRLGVSRDMVRRYAMAAGKLALMQVQGKAAETSGKEA